jgi:hypothetical protein
MSLISTSRASAEMAEDSRKRALNSSASRAVAVGNNASSCVTYATPLRKACGRTFSPFTSSSPVSTRPLRPPTTRPARMFSSVVLPAPEGPKMATTSLGEAWPEMPLMIFLGGLSRPQRRRFPMEYSTFFHCRVTKLLLACSEVNLGSKSSTNPVDDGDSGDAAMVADGAMMVAVVRGYMPGEGEKEGCARVRVCERVCT